MYMKHRENGDMVEVLSLPALFDPCKNEIAGRYHSGEELQEPARFAKAELVFPSGEALPRCWTDASYRQQQAN